MESYKLVSRCTVDDARDLAENNMSAFGRESWWNLLWTNKSLDYMVAQCARQYPAKLLSARDVTRHQKVVEASTGKAVGYARWILPESLAGNWLEARVPGVDEEDKMRYEEEFAAADWTMRGDLDVLKVPVREGIRKHAPKRPHMVLDYLAVHPSHQGRGIAGMLVQSGIRQADVLGLDISLVAIGGRALAMYTRNGFELMGQCLQDLEPWGVEGFYNTYFLVRHAANTDG
ncbi:hypothetical protein HIM_10222 [Hirsutella minnesotensis 3608]|uniref:N-acetyltransferase domain-containing protein n=1 Tax=Hirsutella minnesotensis 3608 TaxID=1043627 RepID=A0A0F7ZRX6_9HYPO|nr:hypothetical protein HIM_10222 [Hirsutella minnesotensis 3608]